MGPHFHHRSATLVCVLLVTVLSAVSGQGEPPVWEEELDDVFSEGLREDLRRGNGIGSISAVDPEGQTITYGTDSDFLAVNERTGMVTVKSELDRESTPQFIVEFTASDPQGNTIVTRHTVYVTDINDNNPHFLQRPYSAEVDEDAEVNDEVFSGISVRDDDLGRNAEVTLSCYSPEDSEEDIEAVEASTACEMFEVQQQKEEDGLYSGKIILKQALDYEVKRQYIFTLKAEDRGSSKRSSLVNIVIEVIDIQDMKPAFLSSRLSLSVFENTGAGSSVGVLEARDQDEGNPNPLRLSITSDPDNFFSLAPATVNNNGVYSSVIRSSGNINREPERDNYELEVEAVELVNGQPTGERVSMTIMVTIRDMNDNTPQFSESRYEVTIDEGLARDDQVPNFDMIVSDDDLDENAYFELQIIDDENQVFRLSPTSGTKQVAVALVVNEPRFLDYEKPEYRRQIIRVIARETRTTQQKSSTATVTVNLRDINDNSPKFDQREYSAHINENRPVNYQIETITATDADSGNFAAITYKLTGLGSEFFNVNPTTGRITLAQRLDYETQSIIDLTYQATDGGGRVTEVPFKVNVLNFNDQAPVFEVDQYQTFAGEMSTVLTPDVTVNAEDRESDFLVSYSIIGGNTPDGAFAIDEESGEFYLTRTVNYKETGGKGFFELRVQASDNDSPPQTAVVIVTVTIRDENDNRPEFDLGQYRRTVTEVTPPGTSVVTVTATDEDGGQNGIVNYIILSGAKDNFQLYFESGLISVADEADLDIERYGDEYKMIVYGVDQGSPALTGTATVYITVEDANNKNPSFGNDVYLVSILESTSVGTLIETVRATDPDSTSNIQYSINYMSIEAIDKNGNPVTSQANFDYKAAFRVESNSGRVRVNSTLNRDAAAEISFVVEAEDLQAEEPKPQIGTASVIITIRSPDDDDDIDFNPPPPDAQNPTFTVTVPEEASPPREIFVIAAEDPITLNRITDFRKIPSTDNGNYFEVDQETGTITLLKSLDYELIDSSQPDHSRTFKLEAFTGGPNVRSATATIIVNIQDMNDHSPEFEKDSYTFDVSEGSRNPEVVGTVTATDEDSGDFGTITYSISGQGTEYFTIDPDTGKVYVTAGVTLDRENTPTFNMLVTATDGAGGSGTTRVTSVPLTIVLTDENDNKPRFTKLVYDFRILETSDSFVSLGQVRSQDEDEGNNGQVDYSIVSGNDNNLFEIETISGIIRTQRPLGGYARISPYVLTVQGRDRGTPDALSSETTVRVFVETLQSTDGQPQFIFPDEDGFVFNITEEPVLGTNITRIEAVDRDGQQLTFSFFSNNDNDDSSYFDIDRNTGRISVKKNLDRELQGEYELIIVVRDNGIPPQDNFRRIIINLNDKDDKSPSFYDCPDPLLANPQVAHVEEEQDPPVAVTRVKACDLDEAPYNVVYYFIIAGNRAQGGQDVNPFYINRTTGQIITQVRLDREIQDRYLLTVKVSSDPNPPLGDGTTRRRRQAGSSIPTDEVGVLVVVDDVDDNGPSFDGVVGGKLVAGVSATAKHGTELLTIYATDKDDNVYTVSRYSLHNIQYVGPESKSESVPYAFRIEAISGVVQTNRTSFVDYVDGYFQMEARVTDGEGRQDSVELYIYVVRSNQRLRLVFDSPPADVKDLYPELFEEMGYQFQGVDLNPDSMRYHVGDDAHADFDVTDLCFHMVRDNKVLNTDVALQMIADKLDANDDLQALFNRYSVEDHGVCEVKMTTKKWDDYFWLWWILIALAILIFLLALILICCICCCWPKYKKHVLGQKPNYVVLNSVPMSGIASGGIGSTLGTRYPDYEWQEEVVKMD